MDTLQLPELGYRIGIVGNRDLSSVDEARLSAALAVLLTRLCDGVVAIQEKHGSGAACPLYADQPPHFFLIDALAEGSDQLAATVASGLGYEFTLFCPIPFSAECYKSYFDSDSGRQQFDELVSTPHLNATVIDLDCQTDSPVHRREGYRAAADMLLENVDILIALHDPRRESEPGGTTETVHLAVQRLLPVFQINTKNPDDIGLLRKANNQTQPSSAVTVPLIEQLLEETLLPHTEPAAIDVGADRKQPHDTRCQGEVRRFFTDPLLLRAGWRYRITRMFTVIYPQIWKALYWVLKFREGEPDTKAHCHVRADAVSVLGFKEHVSAMQRPFRQQYQVLDRMAVQYMDSYRGSFILNFLLGAVAVFFAVQSYFTVPPGQHGHQFWSVLELICLFAILGTYLANRLGDWKKKAVDLRFLAEYLRHIEVLILLGRSTRLLQLAPHHHAHRQPANTWMGWYLNAFLRAQGPFPGLQSQDTARTVTMDAGYAKRVQQYMCGDWLEYQYGYHTQQARRYARWETRSAGLMTVLFAVIVLCVVAHLVGWQWWHPSGWHPDALIALAVIVLPALLAAIHGITVQGEFERLAERSAATADYLEKMIPSFNAINPDKHYDFADAVGDHAVEAAQAMIEEVTDWQILYRAHGVELT